MLSISSTTVAWAKSHQFRHWFKDQTTSTNQVAKQETESFEDFKLFITNSQTQGRGRGSNSWSNPEKNNSLLSSWVYKIDFQAQHFFPALVGLALFDACQKSWGNLAWSLKAPNDLFIKDKKVAGLLIETIEQGHDKLMLIGLGFNIHSSPKEIDTSSYLSHFLNDKESLSEKQWNDFLSLFKNNLDQAIRSSSQAKISEDQRDRLLEALNSNPWITDTFIEVTDQGDLVTGTQTISWRDL